MFVKSRSRGQAIVETALFIPLFLLLLLALIYFSRLGVLQERAQLAVRYGSEISAQSNLYSVNAMYAELNTTSGGVLAEPGGCPGTVVSDTAAALSQSQSGTATPAPVFWQSDSAPSVNCTYGAYTVPVGNGGSVYMSTGFATALQTSLSAQMALPSALQPYVAATGVNATMTSLTGSPPAVILYCRPKVTLAVTYALSGNPTIPYGQFGPPSGFTPHNC